MKGKIRIILDELRDIERTEGLGAITEGKINEICKAQGVSFDEFKSSVLKILAEEAGISLDELNSFLLEEIGELEEISELDLDKISGGASVPDTVKRGAASLMAILNLSGMSNSYADSSDKVVTDHRITINDEIDDEVPYEKVALNKKEMVKKWAKRLGIPVTVLLVAVIGLNKLKNKENNASGDKAKTISVAELNKMNWKRLSGGEAREIAPKIFTSEDNKLSLKSKFYVHMSEGKDKYKGALMYVVGYIKPHDGNKPSILISDDNECLWKNENSGTVQIFENGLINDGDERTQSIIESLRKTYANDMGNSVAASASPTILTMSDFGSNSSSGSSSWEPDESILMEAERIYESEHTHKSTINEQIKKLKIKRLALQLSSPTLTFKEAEAAMTDIEAELYRLEKESKYFQETQKNNWQCKFASTVCPKFSNVLEAFGFSTDFNDLALGIIGTEDMDHYLDGNYQANLTGNTWKEAMANPPTGRTSSRYMPLFSDGRLLHTLKKIVRKSRPAMLLNLLGKTLTRNSEKSKKNVGVLHGLDQKIINNKKIIDDLSEAIQDMNAYHQCSGDTFQKMLETGSVLSMDRQRSPFIGKTDQEKLRYIWESLDKDIAKPTEDFEKLIKNYDKPGVADFLKTCVGGQRWSKIFQDLWENSVLVRNIPVNTLRKKPYVFSIDALDNDLECNENKRIERVDTEFQQAARMVRNYMREVKSTELISHQPGGLSATKDAVAGTTTTVFSILGGNKMAIEEYALKFKSPGESIGSRKGCIIEIPNRCVSYVSPYALLLDADYYSIANNINSKKDSYAVVNGKDNGIKVDMKGIGMNVTNGLIALADSPYVNVEVEWASSIGDEKCTKKYVDITDANRQVSQMLRSRKLNPSDKDCATALAIYMFCQYVILNDGRVPADADEVLETSYQMVGSHACMEGHSPGEIPLCVGGIERVLMIGYDENNDDDKKVIEDARDQKLKVKCIKEVPKTRAEFIAAFEGCT